MAAEREGRRLPESSSRLFFVALALSSCTSNHHVSPWGDAEHPSLGAYIEKGDMDAHLAVVADDDDLRGMTQDGEWSAELEGSRIIVKSFHGRGLLKETTHATRVVTPFGVILALGPSTNDDLFGHEAGQLIPGIGKDADGRDKFRSLTDLTGLKRLDLIVRARDGHLSIYDLNPRGATKLECQLETLPTRALDIGDGHMSLGGTVKNDEEDPISPDLVDVASFEGGRFSDQAKAARDFHRKERDARTPKLEEGDETAKAKAAIEWGWHSLLAGDDRETTLKRLATSMPEGKLRPNYEDHLRRIFLVGKR